VFTVQRAYVTTLCFKGGVTWGWCWWGVSRRRERARSCAEIRC